MKNLVPCFFLVVFSVFANTSVSPELALVHHANKQSYALEILVKSYINLKPNDFISQQAFECNKAEFEENIETLFSYAENCEVTAIKLVGAQLNAWDELNIALKLPPTKLNRIRVFHKSRTLLAENDKIINAFRPMLIKAASTKSVNA